MGNASPRHLPALLAQKLAFAVVQLNKQLVSAILSSLGHRRLCSREITSSVVDITLVIEFNSPDIQRPPISVGDTFQDAQWKPATLDSTEPYVCCVPPAHTIQTHRFTQREHLRLLLGLSAPPASPFLCLGLLSNKDDRNTDTTALDSPSDHADGT